MPNNELEFMRLIFVFFQQLTTLNLAAAALVPVVAKALDLSFKISVAAMVCFTASVIGSGWGMYITATRINNDRQFGISFQFGEIGAVGVAFGENNRYELKLFVQHVSNGNINRENWGQTTPGITFSMALP